MNKHRRERRMINTRRPIRSVRVVDSQLAIDLDLNLKENHANDE